MPSYGGLVLAQALLVLLPVRPWRLASSRILGLVIPAAALVLGVTIARASGGADFLTALAAVATPVLAAGAGWTRGWRLPWLPAVVVPLLYLDAWLRPGTIAADAAGVVLICGACLTVTAVVAALAPGSWLTAGLVGLVILDCIFVWGDRQVEPAMQALQAASAPSVGGVGHPLPSLQQAELGTATMGWLDFAAPALLAILTRHQVRAALATGLAGAAWGLLLLVTSPIAATPPILAGLVVGGRRQAAAWRRSGGRLEQPGGSAGRPAERRPAPDALGLRHAREHRPAQLPDA